MLELVGPRWPPGFPWEDKVPTQVVKHIELTVNVGSLRA